MKRCLSIWVFVVALLLSFRVEAEGVVTGFVFEQDSITPIEGSMISFSGIAESGDTLYYQFISDTLGYYEAVIQAGTYQVFAEFEGYSPSFLSDSLCLENDSIYFDINFILNELYLPVHDVEAELFMDDFVRVSWSMHDGTTRCELPQAGRSFRYYDLFRRCFEEEPVMLASHLTDTVFMDMNWADLPWGKYSWGVSCWYEGNRAASDTIWSDYLDKDMTTTFELLATTNIGLIPEGASVWLASCNEQGQSYHDVLDENGRLLLSDVYRGDYLLNVYLNGYENFTLTDTIQVYAPVYLEIELVEQILEIDSLYVSSTGWAIWQLSDAQSRDLQYFEVMINGQLVATTTEQQFQFEVGSLVDWESYLVQVRPVFLSATGEWRTYEWTYLSCSNYPGTVNGLHWTLLEDAVLLSWQYHGNVEIEGVRLYRDGEFLAVTDESSFVDYDVVMYGNAEYCLRVVYGGIPDGTYYSMSCEECVTVSFPLYCEPPTNLEGENYYESDTDYGALISWGERPPLVEDWLRYDNGVFKNVIGNDEEPILFWAIRFDEEDLLDYQGTELKKIAIYDACAGTYQLWIYVGGDHAPQTLVRYQNMNLVGSNQWFEQVIDPYEIPENDPIWIVVGQQGLDRPAAACADTGDPDGRWVSMNGIEWKDMNYYNVHYTWMLRAFVSNRTGKQILMDRDNFTLQCYKLYRSFDNDEYQPIAVVPNHEGQAFYQYRDVLVGSSFEHFYYRLTAVYLSDEGEYCESDYAASLLNPDQNFVEIDDHWSMSESAGNVLVMYPNPSTGCLTVKTEAMQRVSVFNALGQCLKEVEVQADAIQLDLSELVNGLYLLRVTTENGTLTQRFLLSR